MKVIKGQKLMDIIHKLVEGGYEKTWMDAYEKLIKDKIVDENLVVINNTAFDKVVEQYTNVAICKSSTVKLEEKLLNTVWNQDLALMKKKNKFDEQVGSGYLSVPRVGDSWFQVLGIVNALIETNAHLYLKDVRSIEILHYYLKNTGYMRNQLLVYKKHPEDIEKIKNFKTVIDKRFENLQRK